MLQQKDVAYLNKNQAQLEAMNIEAASFGYEHVPLSWLPKELHELQCRKLGREPDAAAAAADKGKGKAKPVFAWGKAKEAADILTGFSSGAAT